MTCNSQEGGTRTVSDSIIAHCAGIGVVGLHNGTQLSWCLHTGEHYGSYQSRNDVTLKSPDKGFLPGASEALKEWGVQKRAWQKGRVSYPRTYNHLFVTMSDEG